MNNPFIGTILYFGFDWAPDGWVKCDGSVVKIQGKESLFSLLQTTFGGDGKTTFGLPDLQDRSIIGYNSEFPFSTFGGNIASTMQAANLPGHNHLSGGDVKLLANTDGGTVTDPTGNYFSASDTRANNYGGNPTDQKFSGAAVATVAAAGTSTPVITIAPSLALNPCIAYKGIFPQRG